MEDARACSCCELVPSSRHHQVRQIADRRAFLPHSSPLSGTCWCSRHGMTRASAPGSLRRPVPLRHLAQTPPRPRTDTRAPHPRARQAMRSGKAAWRRSCVVGAAQRRTSFARYGQVGCGYMRLASELPSRSFAAQHHVYLSRVALTQRCFIPPFPSPGFAPIRSAEAHLGSTPLATWWMHRNGSAW